MGKSPSEPESPELDQEFLGAILDAVAHPVFVKNRQFRFVFLNRALCEMVGYPLAEMLGKTDYDFFPKAEADFFRKKDLELIETGASVTIDEEPITDVKGRRHILSTTKVPLKNAAGEVTYVVGIIHDITQLEEAKEELRIANECLESRVRDRTQELMLTQHKLVRQERLALLGQLAASLAHQIRNPLAAITNAAFVLRRLVGQHENADVARAIDIVLEEALEANRTVTDLVEYARMRPPEPRLVSIDAVLDDVLERVTIRPVVEVVREVGTLPELRLDRAQLTDALRNIVQNALDSMPADGTVTFRAACRDRELVLSIEDTGTGVSSAIADRLFEPLVTTKVHGFGLGLATAKSLIENQGGTITYRARQPTGSCFELRLPIDHSERPPISTS